MAARAAHPPPPCHTRPAPCGGSRTPSPTRTTRRPTTRRTSVSDGTVYVSGLGPSTTESAVFAVSATTGRRLWEVRESGIFFVPPTATGETVLVSNLMGSEQNILRALDAKTGRLIWKRHLADDSLTRPVTADGTVYVVGDGVLYALRADTGRTLWQYATKTSVRAAPLVVGDTVYLSSSTGKVYAIRA
ncbi:PQQ-binding-like beta-propeller repeat protein [Streptomyces sp. NPDC021969]|uniref:outer membrane protein assembly factor BamB family protein n=1 Tax=unclassified Streptomyces TaxID=2593676 RepID=UPI0034104622